jgi:hypothetical protein
MGLRFEPGSPVSYIYPEKIATIDAELIVRKLGSTPAHLLQEITARVARVLGISP